MARVLAADDDSGFRQILQMLLTTKGHGVLPVGSAEEASAALIREPFDLLICDVKMDPGTGMDVLKTAREVRPNMPVVMVTAHGTVDTALESLRMGAFDYVTKPFRVADFLLTVERALAWDPEAVEDVEPRVDPDPFYRFGSIVAASESMRLTCQMVERVAPAATPALFCGPTGTGKTLLAQALHALSPRRAAPFLTMDCAALEPDDLFFQLFGTSEQGADEASGQGGSLAAANGGSLFLRRIEKMPVSAQDHLINILRDKQIKTADSHDPVPLDVRVISSTESHVEDMVGGNIRQELYMRLAAIVIEIQPLRERVEDILPLAAHFLRLEHDQAALPVIERDACGALQHYAWPGNATELRDVVLQAAGEGNRIAVSALPPYLMESLSGKGNAAPGAEQNGHRAAALRAFLRSKESALREQMDRGAQSGS